VALSGTLDTFALPDVLRLLASTQKSGRLRVSGNRGSGSVWVTDGEVVASELTSINSLDPSAVEVVFGLLRFDAGSFTFEADAEASNPGPGMAMDPILSSAEHMLIEWRTIEEVVPSLDVWVGLLPELSGTDVRIDAMRWRAIAAVGSGVQVGLIAETLVLNEVDTCRLVKELIELGLMTILDTPADVSAAPAVDPIAAIADDLTDSEEIEPTVVAEDEPVDVDAFISMMGETAEPAAAADELATEVETVETVEIAEPVEDVTEIDPLDQLGDVPTAPSTVPSLAALASSDEGGEAVTFEPEPEPEPVMAEVGAVAAEPTDMFGAATEAEASDDDLNPAEMARQLANLSPKAAKAVAAAAKASTDAEREAALAAVEAEDGSVNRGLLLKFLGSVDS
jgi:hypothetical protein